MHLKKSIIIAFCVFCVAIFMMNVTFFSGSSINQTFNKTEVTSVETGQIEKIHIQPQLYSSSNNGNDVTMCVYPCELVCCFATNTGYVRDYYMEYRIETVMSANTKNWEIMGGEPQAGNSNYCHSTTSNAGWSTILHMKWPACCEKSPSQISPSNWPLNSHPLNTRAFPQNAIGCGSTETKTYAVGFDGGFGYMGVSAGITLTDSTSVTYSEFCINPEHLKTCCLEFETSDNMGSKTSNAVSSFTVYVGSAIQTSNEWTHIFICEDSHYVSISPTSWSGTFGCIGHYSCSCVQTGGGYNYDSTIT
ncbi:MAG: hypothetical protein AMDU5_GPLC00019G0026 [Thermoplasmatales archaeon Gpl]|jgi:hypothetical protein|nr:MAG: hypothetical protein AMDU5_GPLC00019G0026 [Thermoplasmatales archaeon Gpl]